MLVFLFMNPFPLHFPICWWHEARGTSMAMASSATSCRSSVLKNFAQVLWREGLTQTWCPIATLVVISRLTIGFVVGVLCAYVILYIIIYIYYTVYIYIFVVNEGYMPTYNWGQHIIWNVPQPSTTLHFWNGLKPPITHRLLGKVLANWIFCQRMKLLRKPSRG
jgi:hypothetical protein